MKKKTAYMGLLCAAAIILGYVESLFPVFAGVPGMKIGLPNLAVVMVLYLYTWKEALAVSFVRILVIGFLFGNAFSILYSLSGGILSFLVMFLMKKTDKFSCVSVSITGGISHNIGQIIVAAWIVNSYNVFFYVPVLLFAGLVTGLLIGVIAKEVIVRLKNITL